MIHIPGYIKWVSDRMWYKGLHLFADADNSKEIEKIAFQISISKEPTIVSRNYKGNTVFLLYQEKNQFPIVPTMYYYSTLDTIDDMYLYLSDVISFYRSFLFEVQP